jgi:tetratricopeptide (TPR) repeat protein
VRLLAGDLAYHENRAGDALHDYQAAYTIRPSLSEAYFRAGVVLRNRGSIPEAQEAFQLARQANLAAPAIPRYSNNFAFCLAKLGRLEEALALYGQNTNYPLSALEASRLLLARGEMRWARDFVQRAVDWLSEGHCRFTAESRAVGL